MAASNCFEGKNALVTGAAQGIGKSVTVALAEKGCHVFAMDKSAQHLKTLKDELGTKADQVTIIECDLSNWEGTRKALKDHMPEQGIHLLVNNVGILPPIAPIGTIPEELYDLTVAINVKSLVNVTQVVSEVMKAKGIAGSIVNLSSLAALLPFPYNTLYSVTKAAVNHMTRILSVDLGAHKIRVNSVQPFIVNTAMIKDCPNEEVLKGIMEGIAICPYEHRLIEPKEVADTVVFLLSDRASMITGAHIRIDGGRVLV